MFQLAYGRLALRIVATLATAASLAACGYKGPLYMPSAATARKGPARAPAPHIAVAPGVHIVPAYPAFPETR